MRVNPAVTALLIGLVLILVVAGSSLTREARLYPWLSPSPYNPGLGGLTEYVESLKHRYRVYLGTPLKVGFEGKASYLIIGPDIPFTKSESARIAGLVRSGRLNLLVADETTTTQTLLKALGLPGLDGTILNESISGGGWEFIVSIRCNDQTAYASKAVRVPQGMGGRVICRYGDGSPAAVLYNINGSRVLVVGDSSIFANYLYLGYGALTPTKNIDRYLTSIVAGNTRILIVDDSHYTYTQREIGAYPLTGLWREISGSLGELPDWASRSSPFSLLLALIVASAPWAMIFYFPWERPPSTHQALEEATGIVLEIEASRLGLEVKAEPGKSEALAGKILKEVEPG